jgi:hypothetical protein
VVLLHSSAGRLARRGFARRTAQPTIGAVDGSRGYVPKNSQNAAAVSTLLLLVRTTGGSDSAAVQRRGGRVARSVAPLLCATLPRRYPPLHNGRNHPTLAAKDSTSSGRSSQSGVGGQSTSPSPLPGTRSHALWLGQPAPAPLYIQANSKRPRRGAVKRRAIHRARPTRGRR